MNFNELNIKEVIKDGLNKMEYTEMTEIQARVIPLALEGKDIIGQAPTGTGKTLAFGIPILNMIDEDSSKVQAVVLAPTRELAVQITKEINTCASVFNKVKAIAIYGGELIERQIMNLKKHPQIVVATPGRLMDHMRRATIRLDHVKIVVMDEADEMLNMGFIEDINTILETIDKEHQTMLFSATFSKGVESIAMNYMVSPKKVLVSNGSLTVSQIEQKYIPCMESDKVEIISRLIEINEYKLVMVFCNTKRGVDEVTTALLTKGFLAEALHGDMRQMQRDRVMARFREGTINVLVASDVAARGLDIDDVEVVFNYDLPTDDEYYVHRIGRTGRATKTGLSISLVTKGEKYRLTTIKKYAKVEIELMTVPTLDKVIKVRTSRLLDRAMAMAQNNNNFEEVSYENNKFLSIIEKQVSKYEDVDKDTLIKGLLSIIINADSRNSEIQEVKEEIDNRRSRYSNGGVRMFITLGRKDDIKVYSITDMLVKSTNLTNADINNITICDSFSFFEIPSKEVDNVLALSGELRYKGRILVIEQAKKEPNKKGSSRSSYSPKSKNSIATSGNGKKKDFQPRNRIRKRR